MKSTELFKKIECNVNWKSKVELSTISMLTDFFSFIFTDIFSAHTRQVLDAKQMLDNL